MQIPKQQRAEDKDHLKRISSLPCMICESIDVHAHHLMRAESRGMGYKTGDNWTVPLCVGHHAEVHGSEGEIAFFETRNWPYERVKMLAMLLWEMSHA